MQGNVLEPNTQPNNTLFPWRGPEPPRGKLFRNDLKAGDPKLSFTDVTQKSGILATGYGMGAATGDINNDGCLIYTLRISVRTRCISTKAAASLSMLRKRVGLTIRAGAQARRSSITIVTAGLI